MAPKLFPLELVSARFPCWRSWPTSELPLSNSLPDMTSLSGGWAPSDVTAVRKTSGAGCQQPMEDENGAEEMEDDMHDKPQSHQCQTQMELNEIVRPKWAAKTHGDVDGSTLPAIYWVA